MNRQTPIRPATITPNGAFGAVRLTSAQGACGVSSHPCTHLGVDLRAPSGSPVYAPVRGMVVATGDGESSPWRGYGPFVVVILGADGFYHLIAHMNPGLLRIGEIVSPGQSIGTVSDANHVHWELRRKLTPGSGGTNATNNLDPMAWVSGSYGANSDQVPKIIAFSSVGALLWYGYRTWRKRGGTFPDF